MSGFTGNDGSELVGGLNPSGQVKALSVDASGNLNANLTGVSTATLYTSAQTNTGSGNSGDLDVSKVREISIDITTTLVTTNLQFFWERKGADGNYYPLWQSAVLTASANTLSTSIGPGLAYSQSLGPTGRLRWTATGNASFTSNVYGK